MNSAKPTDYETQRALYDASQEDIIRQLAILLAILPSSTLRRLHDEESLTLAPIAKKAYATALARKTDTSSDEREDTDDVRWLCRLAIAALVHRITLLESTNAKRRIYDHDIE